MIANLPLGVIKILDLYYEIYARGRITYNHYYLELHGDGSGALFDIMRAGEGADGYILEWMSYTDGVEQLERYMEAM